MTVDDYLASLDRALSKMPEKTESDARFVVPELRVMPEGKTTVLENFTSIVDTINRDQTHFFKFLVRELGTAGKIDGNRLILQGRFAPKQIRAQVEAYVKEYVMCSECGRPDTRLVKNERVLMLKCDACGAIRPIKKRFIKQQTVEQGFVEGSTYTICITAVGAKGDGIAKKGKYTIFVKGTKKGDVVEAVIKKIAGNLVFANVVNK